VRLQPTKLITCRKAITKLKIEQNSLRLFSKPSDGVYTTEMRLIVTVVGEALANLSNGVVVGFGFHLAGLRCLMKMRL
jgi:hypothetical protein